MNTEKTDKNLSGILVLCTIGFILFAMGADGGFTVNDPRPLKEILLHMFNFYFDFILIGYVFICLQIAGYLELKHKQDFLTISIISILFTPLSIFFIYQENKNDE